MRARFDANKDVKEMRVAEYLLADGCRQLWKSRHPFPVRCKHLHCNKNNKNFNFHSSREWPGRHAISTSRPGAGWWDCWVVHVSREGAIPILLQPAWTAQERASGLPLLNLCYNQQNLQEHWHKIEEAWDAELDSIQRELPEEKETEKDKTASPSPMQQ